MSAIPDSKKLIQIQETQYRSAVSESTIQKIGGNQNFIINRFVYCHKFTLNGLYENLPQSEPIDGKLIFLWDAEIVGITISQKKSGTSGTTGIDIQWYSAPSVLQGSIFSVKPVIDSTSSDNDYIASNLSEPSDNSPVTGWVFPTLLKTEFNKFESIDLSLDSAMGLGKDLEILIYYRSR